MNNLKEYNEFVNEEFNFKKIKSRVNIGLNIVKFKALLYGLRLFLFWNKDFMISINVVDTILEKFKQFSIFMNNYDEDLDRVSDNGSDDEIRDLINIIKLDYESKFNSSFVDDFKKILEKVVTTKKIKNPKTPKEIKKSKRLIRILSILDDREYSEEDPYGEEEWDDNNEFKIFDILRDGRRMTPEEFIDHIKGLILNKNISFLLKDKGDNYNMMEFRTKILVKDVKLKRPQFHWDGIILIDEKGQEFEPNKYDSINILD